MKLSTIATTVAVSTALLLAGCTADGGTTTSPPPTATATPQSNGCPASLVANIIGGSAYIVDSEIESNDATLMEPWPIAEVPDPSCFFTGTSENKDARGDVTYDSRTLVWTSTDEATLASIRTTVGSDLTATGFPETLGSSDGDVVETYTDFTSAEPVRTQVSITQLGSSSSLKNLGAVDGQFVLTISVIVSGPTP